MAAQSVRDLLAPHAAPTPALLAPGRPPLTHGALRTLADETVAALNGFGVGRDDRVAIVLPNGPEMAAAFLAVACAAATAPLNPAYKEEEFDFYLGDLRAKALIVGEDDAGPAVAVARRHGLRVLRLRTAPDAPAGHFTLVGENDGTNPAAAKPGPAGPDDTALVLHTSGTTSRPKIVPLLHRNVAASAAHIGAALALTPDDRCLNVMPLFHIHGLIAATLSSLAAGGSTYCAPGFNALRFFAWLDEAEPTGTPPSRRCTRRSSPAPRATPRASRRRGCG
jgi:acyl-CoA synthetase (AMP-forming)/AMP-acid ligase II